MITGREPALSSTPRSGWRLSPRRLATLLLNLPPEAISLAAAEEMLISADLLIRFHGASLLAKRADRDARLIIERHLRAGKAPTRASVARRLASFTWYAVEPLLRLALDDADARVREAAIYALCDVATVEAYQVAAEALRRESDDMVFLAAAIALRRRSDADAAPLLELALRAQDEDVRVKALETLGENATPAAAPIIQKALHDVSPDVLDAAAQSYIEVRGAEGLPVILARILQTQGEQRHALLRGMNQAANRLFIDLATVECADNVLDTLTVTACDDSSLTRRRTVMCLAWIRHPRADAILQVILDAETDDDTRADMQHIVTSLRRS